MKYLTIINNEQFEVEINRDGTLTVNGQVHEIDFRSIGPGRYSLLKNHKSLEIVVEITDQGYEILMGGRRYTGQVLDERAISMANRKGGLRFDTGEVHSPMPGLIVQVTVAVGDVVAEGQTVVILESMKMQNELKAPRAGKVEQVLIAQGQTVEKGALLVVIGDAD